MKIKSSFAIICVVIVINITNICYASSLAFEDIKLAGGIYSYKKIAVTKSNAIENMFIEALGGRAAYDKIPVIKLGDKSLVSITPKMMQASIVKGSDKLGRRFIAYKQENKKTGEEGVEVFYQRYSDYPSLWINGGDSALKYLFPINRGIITKESVEQFANMIKNESFVLTHDIEHDRYKEIYEETSKDIHVSDEVIEKIKQVIRAGLHGELPSHVRFLERDDRRAFILEDIAPEIIFKYYARDINDGYYVKSWHDDACIARNICEVYELDLLIIPKTQILKVNIEGEDFYLMVKENTLPQNRLVGYEDEQLQQVLHQLLTLMFKTGLACIGPDTLFLLNVGDEIKAAVTCFEEFNYGIANRNLVDQFFDLEVFKRNKQLVEFSLSRFTYFEKNMWWMENAGYSFDL